MFIEVLESFTLRIFFHAYQGVQAFYGRTHYANRKKGMNLLKKIKLQGVGGWPHPVIIAEIFAGFNDFWSSGGNACEENFCVGMVCSIAREIVSLEHC